MSRGLGRIQRECLRVIESYEKAGKEPTTFNIVADVYQISVTGTAIECATMPSTPPSSERWPAFGASAWLPVNKRGGSLRANRTCYGEPSRAAMVSSSGAASGRS